MSSYLLKFKGEYRLKCPHDLDTNLYPRKLNDTLEDIDMYIDCKTGNKIFHFGKSTLQAYIPSLMRGNNVLKLIEDNCENKIVFEIEKTDKEVLFKFDSKYIYEIIPFLKPKTSGANISPFSTKNLPKNKSYIIPDEEIGMYKNIIATIPIERILTITHTTNSFLKTISKKKNKLNEIKADMALKGLKGKEYIHSIGKWEKYINYLNANIK